MCLPSDCPATGTVCATPSCTNNACDKTYASAGTTCDEAGGKVCSGNGFCVVCVMPTDCAAPTTACKTNTCTANACGTQNVPSGSCNDNGGKLCDGNGTCVACLAPADCAAPTTVCKIATCDGTAHTCGTTNAAKGTSCTDAGGAVCDGNGTCVSMHCMDGVRDADETDVDCGGASCSPCPDTQKCLVGSDCTNKICDSGHHCAVPTCTDGVHNGNETDTDCGGTAYQASPACPKCADKLHCATNVDCVNNDCAGSGPGTCISCSDGIKNGNETDLDCGGGTCAPCVVGKACAADTDCASNACDSLSLLCVASQCSDHRKDGSETDIDCGGGTCPTCALNKHCASDSECASNACDAVALLCVSNQCADNRKDGAETDVDCGGGVCAACATGLKCLVDGDCVTNACDAITLTCVSSQCSDHRLDGNETDVDCSGACTSKCATGLKCQVNGDCVTNACDAVALVCDASQCADQKKDGAETDVDCGGGTCPTCAANKGCASDSDCTSNACDAVTLLCVSNQCADHRKDGAETDVDCGGGICSSKCATGLKCQFNGDCVTNACDAVALVCDASQCNDQKKDGVETDIDCGGGTCPICLAGRGCTLDSDCTSHACNNITGKCAISACTDQKKDSAETDVDCGGGTCPTCALGQKCQADSDCLSNACDAITLTCVSNQCADHRKDSVETDIDCGGGICSACALGLHCTVDFDCSSNACDAISLTCVSNQCNDHRQDGAESDVDCGGSVCSACVVGKKCNSSFDCQAGHPCNAAHICQ
jgi:hypothetical protein